MRASGSLTVLAALSFAAGGMAVEHPPSTEVAIFLDFEHAAPPAVVAYMEAEVDRILSPSGLQFEWHALNEAEASATFADLAVARFKGACAIRSETLAGRHSTKPIALAATAVADGHVLPFTEVDCHTLTQFLGPEILALPGRDRDRALGRAMGRVLAHELYHIFGETCKHASRGVANAYHSRGDLLAPEFNFRAAESDMFRNFNARITAPASQPEETR